MSDNRYAPPVASVRDVESHPGALQRPRVVRLGITLLWASIIISLPGVIEWISALQGRMSGPQLDWQVLFRVAWKCAVVVLNSWLFYKAWQGRNWARITNLVLMITAFLLTLGGFALAYFMAPAAFAGTQATWRNGVYLLRTLTYVAGSVLLVSPAANAWYRAVRAAKRGA